MIRTYFELNIIDWAVFFPSRHCDLIEMLSFQITW